MWVVCTLRTPVKEVKLCNIAGITNTDYDLGLNQEVVWVNVCGVVSTLFANPPPSIKHLYC